MAGYIICDVCMNERVVGQKCYVCGTVGEILEQRGELVHVPRPDLFTAYVPNQDRITWDRSQIPTNLTYEEYLYFFYCQLAKTQVERWECGTIAWSIAISKVFLDQMPRAMSFQVNLKLPPKAFKGIQ